MAEKIQSPEKELRFTRSGQASVFWVAAAIFGAASVMVLAISVYRDVMNPLWAILPMALAWVLARVAFKLTKHAYLIFTPLGIEIFPFFRPEKTMRLVLWQEIQDAEVNPAQTQMTLHHNLEKTSGVHISLRPILKQRRALLAKAITGRVSRA